MRLILAFLLIASTAMGDEMPKKVSFLQEKAQKKRPRKARREVGRRPEPPVNLYNTWTDEVLVLDGDLDQVAWNQFLRCHFTNQATNMDIRLSKGILTAARYFKKHRIEIVSGYRSSKYNLILRKKGHEVARRSEHTTGSAVDFRIPGVATRKLRAFVKKLRMGGVGFYPESEFVHVDTGPVRTWAGR